MGSAEEKGSGPDDADDLRGFHFKRLMSRTVTLVLIAVLVIAAGAAAGVFLESAPIGGGAAVAVLLLAILVVFLIADARSAGTLVLLDAKRGDIGSTMAAYAAAYLDEGAPLAADAVTVSPYMGFDSVEPYMEWADRGVIVLCRTSNAGGSDLQFLDVGGRPLYQHVAQLVAEKWNKNGQCALVVGATFPEELAQVRAIVGDMPFLVPGVGAQGGDVEAVVGNAKTADGTGLMVSSSRAILYASNGDDYADAAAREARTLRDAINRFR